MERIKGITQDDLRRLLHLPEKVRPPHIKRHEGRKDQSPRHRQGDVGTAPCTAPLPSRMPQPTRSLADWHVRK